MLNALFLPPLFLSSMAFAMGEKPEVEETVIIDGEEVIIIESVELCDPKEQATLPHFY